MRISDWSSDVCSSDLVIYVGRLKVWRDFQENRRPRRSPLHHYGSEQGVECALVLQRAQTGRVGGTDVDGQIIRQGRHVAHARRIISYPVRRVLVGPDIDAGEAALRAMALQAGNGGGPPPIVDDHAVAELGKAAGR